MSDQTLLPLSPPPTDGAKGVSLPIAFRRAAYQLTALLGVVFASNGQAQTQPATCSGKVYLTIDTGSMSQADLIARTLNQHNVKATFFVANEKTVNGDHSLDDGWRDYWKARVAEGHHFGSHTHDHVYWKGDLANGKVRIRPQFGPNKGKFVEWTQAEYCTELNRARDRFKTLTGADLQPIWRAPGGHTSARLKQFATACGYSHVHWADAGFLGDELPSDTYPNQALLKRALANIKSGDILMMHTGIWARKDPFAPMLDPLIAGLKQRGLCFDTLPATKPS
jgi:peptidoglycan/xylan/chitin deacetylase (PgdA/CDA1 family)